MKNFEAVKVDSREIAKSLKTLSTDDRLKIYYMIKGIELVSGVKR